MYTECLQKISDGLTENDCDPNAIIVAPVMKANGDTAVLPRMKFRSVENLQLCQNQSIVFRMCKRVDTQLSRNFGINFISVQRPFNCVEFIQPTCHFK